MTNIERSALIHAPRTRVWRALTDLAEFSAWFQVKAEGAFAPGAALRMMSTHPEALGVMFHMTVEEMIPEQTFSWRWNPGAEPPPDGEAETTLVEFRLMDEADGTRVAVTESGFDRISPARRAKVFEENTKGWEYQLAALESYLHLHP
jgi:uncharacterized protein YndB with AHSA1/START domain